MAIVGNPKSQSRTHRVAEAVARLVDQRWLGGHSDISIIDLADHADYLLDWAAPAVEDLVQRVLAADLLIVASPTYKATYTGLLKIFLDRIAGGAMKGTIAVPVMLAGAPHHALAVEVHLRPLLVELGAMCVTPGLFVLERELDALDERLDSWWAAAEDSFSC